MHLHDFRCVLHIAFRPPKKARWLHTNDGSLNISRPHLAHFWHGLTCGGLAPCPACEIALPPLLQVGIIYLGPALHEQDMWWLSLPDTNLREEHRHFWMLAHVLHSLHCGWGRNDEYP